MYILIFKKNVGKTVVTAQYSSGNREKTHAEQN